MGGQVGGGGGGSGRGVRLDVNEELKFFVKIKKKMGGGEGRVGKEVGLGVSGWM